ncbi:uncharacterized protein N7482_009937 [Penicillium canariense]|uniref:Uncharacterized protein n=1 Tax=Penicillium canariense TaxID=189055 RepID=A0A9W9LG61_9EURO|nr:uncharacterized protein N7482_009937 [Penicillium canariense]KAJ5153459.1 hypothetical protein N7482_009937 [Penicillium canariense]
MSWLGIVLAAHINGCRDQHGQIEGRGLNPSRTTTEVPEGAEFGQQAGTGDPFSTYDRTVGGKCDPITEY